MRILALKKYIMAFVGTLWCLPFWALFATFWDLKETFWHLLALVRTVWHLFSFLALFDVFF